MVDITSKSNTLRTAIAEAILHVGSVETIELIKNDQIPKGNVFEMSKAAGLLGIKKTPELLPDCHPLPVESASIKYEMGEQSIRILVTVKTIYKTGVEVEAMTGAGIVALNMYDMLKPVDKKVEIGTIRLLEKKGGKSSRLKHQSDLQAAVIVCSDSISKGIETDQSGKAIRAKLQDFNVDTNVYKVIPDEKQDIENTLLELIANDSVDLIIYTGGTGVGPRDVTSDTVTPLLDTELNGVSEQIRRYGQERMPYAMLSRAVVGIRDGKVVLTLPGSVNGAKDGIDACFPHILHVFDMIQGKKH
ncbi:MAG: bifunctional molybdenum cofactor biosynthesis protein MoaC/MoaB [Bacteroidota bacterium]